MRTAERARFALTAVAACLLAGCMAVAKAPSPAPKPSGAGPTIKQVQDFFAARDRDLASFRAQARLDYKSPQQSFRSTQVVVVRSPADARIDVMNPFGISYTVATDGVTLTAFDRRKNLFYVGRADADNFRHYIGVPLAAKDLANVLRGIVPALGDKRWKSARPTEGGWMMKRGLPAGGFVEFVVQTGTLLPLRVRIYGDRERHEATIVYDDWRDVSGVLVPHHIDVSFKDGSELGIEYKSVQRGIALADDAFRMDKPAGSRLVDMDTEAGGAL